MWWSGTCTSTHSRPPGLPRPDFILQPWRIIGEGYEIKSGRGRPGLEANHVLTYSIAHTHTHMQMYTHSHIINYRVLIFVLFVANHKIVFPQNVWEHYGPWVCTSQLFHCHHAIVFICEISRSLHYLPDMHAMPPVPPVRRRCSP